MTRMRECNVVSEGLEVSGSTMSRRRATSSPAWMASCIAARAEVLSRANFDAGGTLVSRLGGGRDI